MTYTVQGATLLPKLRGNFAEFLSESSLDRLRILSSPTCVGLRYGHHTDSLAAFPGSLGSWNRVPSEDFHRLKPLSVFSSPDLPRPPAYWLRRVLPSTRSTTFLRPRFASIARLVVQEY